MSTSPPDTLPEAGITGLSHDGRGVGRHDGQVVFIDNALPGEVVRFRPGRKRRKVLQGTLTEILSPSPDRVDPECPYFGTCGGCALQHLGHDAQLAHKHRQLVDNLERLAKVVPDEYMAPVAAAPWHYRRKARLGIRYVPKKGGVLVGFRERHKSYITSLDACLVLDRKLSDLLPGLHELVAGLSCFDRIPQIEVAAADNAAALVFRHLEALTDTDHQRLIGFGADNEVQILLQPGGLDSIHPIHPGAPEPLYYEIDGDIRIHFEPTDFIQVNGAQNRRLVDLALALLDPGAADKVLDLFCGVGNFTLPIARRAGRVTGLEGEKRLVRRAMDNAAWNGLATVEFRTADLYAEELSGSWIDPSFNKLLLDPPRSGAMELMKRIPDIAPERIVYISCNPATLARDTEILVRKHGYRLRRAGIIDMFPHTAHVESIAQFDM
ncbi:MAG: 23S rRNA (uracil(1939)-C(5))-methyltransferase RlmD [Gammaproteobacteria bacterium]|nr:23S rRNA (uracil(1939)-C(5))-methyltransferase RlmD [Gammaproteobacteria bacterium]